MRKRVINPALIGKPRNPNAKRIAGTLKLRFGCPVLATVDPAWANAV